MWRRVVGTAGGIFLGVVLLVAAVAKSFDPAAFAAEIERHGLDFLLPATAVAYLALALEVLLGAALLLGIRRRWVLWPSAALVVFFLFLTGRDYLDELRGVESAAEAGCGCFGNLVQRTPAEAFWQDALLMVPALLLAFLGRRRGAGSPRLRLAVVGVLTAGVLLVAWKAPELPLDDLATRLRPGVEAGGLCAGTVEDGSRVCLDGILPELTEGEHLVVLADVTDDEFTAAVDRLNDYHWDVDDGSSDGGPRLWVVSSNSEEELFGFRFGSGPVFEVRDAPSALLRPLYRSLPRSFRVRDGEVVETHSGLPPEISGP